jgi:hypothetical protein
MHHVLVCAAFQIFAPTPVDERDFMEAQRAIMTCHAKYRTCPVTLTRLERKGERHYNVLCAPNKPVKKKIDQGKMKGVPT